MEIGALSQYALAVQRLQLNLIKSNIESQQQVIDILLNSDNRSVAPSENLGQNVDISI